MRRTDICGFAADDRIANTDISDPLAIDLITAQQPLYLGEDSLGQPMAIQKVPAVKKRRLIRSRVFGEFDISKAPHRPRAIDVILCRRIPEIAAAPHKVGVFALHRQRLRTQLSIGVVWFGHRQ